MASLTKDRRILFKAVDGKRKTLRLGKIPIKQAQLITRHVERLIACQLDGSAPPDETSRWLAGVSTALHERLERVGLVNANLLKTTMTIGELIDIYKSRPKWQALKPATKRNKNQSLGYVISHFGVDQAVRSITVADVGDFYAAMRLPKAEGGFELAIATANLAASEASTLTNFAIDAELLDRNPFKTLPRGSRRGDNAMVEEALSRQVLEAMQGSEGQLLFALARWGGLRTPSEPTLLRWCNIDWERDRFLVTSPKTEAFEGHASRWVPIFPDLAPLFDTRFSEAAEGDEYVLPILQAYSHSKATSMLKTALRGLGVEPWSRLWHSLRATCQTELEEVFPTHVVCSWLGNSPRVAHGHYLQVTEEHFAKATQKATQQVTAQRGMKGKTSMGV